MPLFLIFLSSCHFLRLTHDILILMMGFWWYLHLYGKNIGDESRKRTSEYQMSSSSKTQKTSFQFKKMLIWEHRRKEKMCCQGLPPCRIITDLHRRQRWVRVFQYQCFCFLKEKKKLTDRNMGGKWSVLQISWLKTFRDKISRSP